MNKYEIMDMIDEGAYGIVWKATNKQTGALVAIKQFKEGDDDQISRRSIQREIRMLKMLKGQFIVNIKQAFKKKNKVFLIFEYFPKNLLNLIQIYEHGLDPTLISRIIYKLVKCLRFLHQKNIIHRDIKPENILLHNDAEQLKLCDFGFARFLPQPYEDLTEYVATRWYRSPQLLAGQKYGKAADIWALGCILGELIDCQPMFPGENQMDQLYLIRKCLGQLPQKQVQIIKLNPKFKDIVCPPIRSIDTIQARYIGKIQKQALNFMKSCLILDPFKRITVDQALKHPFLLHYSVQDNQHMNEQKNILYSSRKLFYKNQSSKKIELTENTSRVQKNQAIDNNQLTERTEEEQKDGYRKTKNFGQKSNLKHAGSGSLPESSIYKVVHQPSQAGHIMKKNSQSTLSKYNNSNKLDINHGSSLSKKTRKFGDLGHDGSPKLHLKKTSLKKMPKVMSEQKKINYNIDVKLNINLKINERLNKGSQSPIMQYNDGKLPEIKNNSKILKYRLNNKYPGQGINTIYNSYGNLSIMGESKQLNKGMGNIGQIRKL